MATSDRKYSCENAAETLEWMNAIADFLRPYKPLIDSHVVNFFKDSLWELVDEQWMECLRKESVENLLGIPSGLFQMLPNLHVTSLGTVLSQGMNAKKKHEIEILAAVVNAIAHGADAQTIIDVGSGQGYLAQALSFEHQLSVIAIDASLHHSTVTAARAERIKKHYAAKLRKAGHGNLHLKVPQVVTCQVLSSDALTALSTSPYKNNVEEVDSLGSSMSERNRSSCENCCEVPSLVLAGLHACGDLSVSMLRTFVDCEQVKALVGIGCCYNLLSEECFEKGSIPCGFPMSTAAKLSLYLGKNARDLACQVLDKYYPEALTSSPSIGRQGKALRRRQLRRSIESQMGTGGRNIPVSNSTDDFMTKSSSTTMNSSKVNKNGGCHNDAAGTCPRDDSCTTFSKSKFHCDMECKEAQSFKRSHKYVLFKEFCELGLSRLGLEQLQDIDMLEMWREALPFSELVGSYWSLRAALGQLVETYILLDRLLFLQEKGSFVEACLFPIFDSTISPRNVAIVARKAGVGA